MMTTSTTTTMMMKMIIIIINKLLVINLCSNILRQVKFIHIILNNRTNQIEIENKFSIVG
jgi:hypothetical protein